MAEMYTGRPLFPSATNEDQIIRIFRIMGQVERFLGCTKAVDIKGGSSARADALMQTTRTSDQITPKTREQCDTWLLCVVDWGPK
jgi:hypothetical protein